MRYNMNRVQAFDSENCGRLCLQFIYETSRELDKAHS